MTSTKEKKVIDSSLSTALQQFLVLAKTQKGRAATALIEQILSHQQIYFFDELLKCPNIQALNKTPHQNYLDLLKLFAYGTFQDYKEKQKTLPKLSDPQLNKLKQLSIVSMASTQKSMSYEDLMKKLEIINIRALEDMIIECIYQGLVVGTLDQLNGKFEVQYAVGRDICPNDIDSMINTLNDWRERCEKLLVTIDNNVTNTNQQHAKRKEVQYEMQKKIDAAIKDLKSKNKDTDIVADELSEYYREMQFYR